MSSEYARPSWYRHSPESYKAHTNEALEKLREETQRVDDANQRHLALLISDREGRRKIALERGDEKAARRIANEQIPSPICYKAKWLSWYARAAQAATAYRKRKAVNQAAKERKASKQAEAEAAHQQDLAHRRDLDRERRIARRDEANSYEWLCMEQLSALCALDGADLATMLLWIGDIDPMLIELMESEKTHD